MIAFLGSILIVVAVTVVAGWISARVRPRRTTAGHVAIAAAAFPVLSVLLFAGVTAFTILSADRSAPGAAANVGMPIFALAFFLVYAMAMAVVVGLPAAWLTVRLLRPR